MSDETLDNTEEIEMAEELEVTEESNELDDALLKDETSDELLASEEGGLDELPEVTGDEAEFLDGSADESADSLEASELTEEPVDVDGTELEAYESSEVEESEFIENERVVSIVESILFSTDRPQSIGTIKQAFKGTVIKTKEIRQALDTLMVEYAGAERGITLEEVTGGYQLRTKTDNMDYLKRMVKSRPFKLSGPALEVLSIVAYKQPCVKFHVDEVRGVESGHLLRGLMDKGLCAFAGKSELPGKPMLYQTTRKFLEIFSLRNLSELPTLSEIDELLPEGIEVEQIERKETLDEVADSLQQDGSSNYSAATEELEKITDQLSDITTSSDFFEQEKRREKERRDKERAQDIRESIEFGEAVETKDRKWLERYDAAALAAQQATEAQSADEVSDAIEAEEGAEELEATGVETEVSDVEGPEETLSASEVESNEAESNEAESSEVATEEVISEEVMDLSGEDSDETLSVATSEEEPSAMQAGATTSVLIDEANAPSLAELEEALEPYDTGISNDIDDLISEVEKD